MRKDIYHQIYIERLNQIYFDSVYFQLLSSRCGRTAEYTYFVVTIDLIEEVLVLVVNS
mgnify:CR=1 FL=1